MTDIPTDQDNDLSSAPSEPTQTPPRNAAEILYPDDQPKPEGEAPDAEKPPAESAEGTAAGEYKLTMPDGVPLDQELMGKAAPVFREMGLSNDQASRLVPLVSEVQQRVVMALGDDFTALKTDWAKAAKSDPQLGGARWSETMRLADTAMTAGGAPKGSEFRELLDESGLGNHPAFIRVFRALGEHLARGASVRGGKLSREQILYPNDIRH